MPGGDRTGPLGLGPMTGRAAGYCAGYGVPGFANPYVWGGFGRGRGWGRGWGRGFGRGWGRRWGFFGWGVPPVAPTAAGAPVYGAPTLTRDQELQMLKTQAEQFQQVLNDVQKRIEELEKEE